MKTVQTASGCTQSIGILHFSVEFCINKMEIPQEFFIFASALRNSANFPLHLEAVCTQVVHIVAPTHNEVHNQTKCRHNWTNARSLINKKVILHIVKRFKWQTVKIILVQIFSPNRQVYFLFKSIVWAKTFNILN